MRLFFDFMGKQNKIVRARLPVSNIWNNCLPQITTFPQIIAPFLCKKIIIATGYYSRKYGIIIWAKKKKLTKPSYYNTTCQQNLNVNLLYFMGPCDRVEKISATIKELSQQRARLKRNLHSRSPLTGPIQQYSKSHINSRWNLQCTFSKRKWAVTNKIASNLWAVITRRYKLSNRRYHQ